MKLMLDTDSANGVVYIVRKPGFTAHRFVGQRKLRKALANIAGAFFARTRDGTKWFGRGPLPAQEVHPGDRGG
jgi:hypothetical protein